MRPRAEAVRRGVRRRRRDILEEGGGGFDGIGEGDGGKTTRRERKK